MIHELIRTQEIRVAEDSIRKTSAGTQDMHVHNTASCVARNARMLKGARPKLFLAILSLSIALGFLLGAIAAGRIHISWFRK